MDGLPIQCRLQGVDDPPLRKGALIHHLAVWQGCSDFLIIHLKMGV
ncbi:hypothetical protein SAMN04488540_10737 [Ferrimonas sediminum]|uniref:Uncharacterized protein n=1 Tax=Ferrimonas sediminum TaxID=718193 RepID=A0A1G8SX20_9GAMM|nr:hypothetical protein SAMN04488540_10737 [Ferrimonas sediminum]